MNKSLQNIIAILLLISTMALLINNLSFNLFFKTLLILMLFVIKFLLVSFHFMELKKANSFWKISIQVIVLVFFLSIIFLK